MAKILSDSASRYTKKEAQENGIDISYLTVSIKGESYKELEEINTNTFVNIIKEGYIPTTSQPSIGDVLDLYQAYPNEELINITIADGLSGTYNSACAAKGMVDDSERIHVFNSKTLCGPLRYIVDTANALAKNGYSPEDIISEITPLTNRTRSYLIPQDFDFLVRGGRVSAVAGKVGGIIKIYPVMALAQDGTSLEKFITTRSFKKAIQKIGTTMQSDLVTSDCKIYVAHALNESLANEACEIIAEMLPGVEIEMMVLGPAFTTQGGPGCLAIQWIQKHPIMG